MGPPNRGLVVRGEISCPSAVAVTERLRPLLAKETSFPALAWVELTELAAAGGPTKPRQVFVRLLRADGSPTIGLGAVPVVGSCDDAANDIAVFLAVLGTRYDTPAVVNLPVGRPAEASTEMSTARSEPVLARTSGASGSVGVAGGMVRGTAAGTTGQGNLEATLLVPRSWLLRAEVWASGARELGFAGGTVAWRRVGMVLGGGRRWRGGSWQFDLALGAVVAHSRVEGSGFADNYTPSSVDVGTAPSGRVGWAPATLPMNVWFEVGADVWLRPHELSVGGFSGSGSLPALDGFAMLGTSYRFGR